ncbi:MAG: hypothetical protein R2867_10240 [Caldilineaceae bacterium]
MQIEDTLITPDLSYDDVIRLERGDIDSEVEDRGAACGGEPPLTVNLASATGADHPGQALKTLSFAGSRD